MMPPPLKVLSSLVTFYWTPPPPFVMQNFAKVTFWGTPPPLRRMTSFLYSPLNSQSWNFKTNYTQKCIFMPFLDINSHLATNPNNFDINFQSNSESYDWHGLFGTKFRGGQNFLRTVGGFYDEREYSWADWLVLLILINSH